MGAGFQGEGEVHGVGLEERGRGFVYLGGPAFGVGDGQAEDAGAGQGDGAGYLVVGEGYVFQVFLAEGGYLLGEGVQGEAVDGDALEGVGAPVGEGDGDGVLAFLGAAHVQEEVGAVIGAFGQLVVVAEGGFQRFGGAGDWETGYVGGVSVVFLFLAQLAGSEGSQFFLKVRSGGVQGVEIQLAEAVSFHSFQEEVGFAAGDALEAYGQLGSFFHAVVGAVFFADVGAAGDGCREGLILEGECRGFCAVWQGFADYALEKGLLTLKVGEGVVGFPGNEIAACVAKGQVVACFGDIVEIPLVVVHIQAVEGIREVFVGVILDVPADTGQGVELCPVVQAVVFEGTLFEGKGQFVEKTGNGSVGKAPVVMDAVCFLNEGIVPQGDDVLGIAAELGRILEEKADHAGGGVLQDSEAFSSVYKTAQMAFYVVPIVEKGIGADVYGYQQEQAELSAPGMFLHIGGESRQEKEG